MNILGCHIIRLPKPVEVGEETHHFGIMPMWNGQPKDNEKCYVFPTLEKAREALPYVARGYRELVAGVIADLRETTEEALKGSETP